MIALPRTADVVVVGAGFAGLSTAAALVAMGAEVVVLEAEALPGVHSSGRNAAIARRLIEEPAVARLAVEGVVALDALRDAEGRPLLRRTGGYLLGDAALINHLWTVAASIPELVAEGTTRVAADAVRAAVPALAGASFAGGIHVPGDGVVDIHGLLGAFLARLRGRVHTGAALTAIARDAGRVSAVSVGAHTIATGAVVDAAGFHANRVAALAGLGPLPFEPVRRHLFTTAPTDLVAADAPWVWDGTSGYYFRPEGAGLLMCACDQTPWPPEAPIDSPIADDARQTLAAKFDRAVPGLRDVRPARAWAGLRVLTPDHRFVIGPDPRLAGFTWVAGLGGHGMTTACAVGAVAAEAVATGAAPERYRAAFDPARFLG